MNPVGVTRAEQSAANAPQIAGRFISMPSKACFCKGIEIKKNLHNRNHLCPHYLKLHSTIVQNNAMSVQSGVKGVILFNKERYLYR